MRSAAEAEVLAPFAGKLVAFLPSRAVTLAEIPAGTIRINTGPGGFIGRGESLRVDFIAEETPEERARREGREEGLETAKAALRALMPNMDFATRGAVLRAIELIGGAE